MLPRQERRREWVRKLKRKAYGQQILPHNGHAALAGAASDRLPVLEGVESAAGTNGKSLRRRRPAQWLDVAGNSGHLFPGAADFPAGNFYLGAYPRPQAGCPGLVAARDVLCRRRRASERQLGSAEVQPLRPSAEHPARTGGRVHRGLCGDRSCSRSETRPGIAPSNAVAELEEVHASLCGRCCLRL